MVLPRQGSKVGPFRLQEQIGAGLVGKSGRLHYPVWLAQDERSPERLVALKLLAPDAPETVRHYFDNEIMVLKRVERPAQCHLVEFVDEGTHHRLRYLATRYLAGYQRLELVERSSLTPATICTVIAQIADALDYLHLCHETRPVIHRDVNPRNILVDAKGKTVLIDLSAASIPGSTPPGDESVIGSQGYIPPEQYRFCEVPASDQFALALVAYELLAQTSNRLLRTTDSGGSALQQLEARKYQPLLERLPGRPATAQVLIRAIARNPVQRFSDCTTFAYELRQALARDGADMQQLRPITFLGSKPAPRPTDEQRTIWALVLLSGAICALLIVALVFLFGRSTTPATKKGSEQAAPTVALVEGPALDPTSPVAPSPSPAPTATLLPPGTPGSVAPANAAGDLRAAPTGCAMRDRASTEGRVLPYSPNERLIPPSEPLTLIERRGNWFFLQLSDGRQGWCPNFQLAEAGR